MFPSDNLSSLCFGSLLILLAAVPAPASALCPVDCNGDGIVSPAELIRSERVATGLAAYRLCPPADVDGDGAVDGDEVVRGAAGVFGGCPDPEVYWAPERLAPAGPLAEGGQGILPNGRRVDPAGVQIPAETLPTNLKLTPDGRYLIATNDGHRDQAERRFLQIVDTQTLEATEIEVPHFFGLGLTPDGSDLYLAGSDDAGKARLRVVHLGASGPVLDPQEVAELPKDSQPRAVAVSPDGTHAYVVGFLSNEFYSVDLSDGSATKAASPIGNLPYDLLLSPNGKFAYVSSWGINNGNTSGGGIAIPAPLPPVDPNAEERSSVACVDLSNPSAPSLVEYMPIGLPVDNLIVYGGSHPSALGFSPQGSLLYVTGTNDDVLDVIQVSTNVAGWQPVAEVELNVIEGGPLDTQLQGLYPNALAVSSDGRRVYVADAGINAVQVLDVDPLAQTFTTAGFIPTGWYPSALALSSDDSRLYVANGKGDGVGPNDGPGDSNIKRLLKGSISVIDGVDQYDLQSGTAQVMAANGFAPTQLHWSEGEPQPGEVERRQPVPIDYGSGPSDLIRHVVFILKENRTYDQVLGDLPNANGDPNLTFYGEEVTPNAHALATEFAEGDNFFADAEVSTPGHEWVDQANDTDFTEKIWPANYDGGVPSSTLEQGMEGFSKAGFFFEALEREGVPYRVYGETLGLLSHFSAGNDGGGVISIGIPLLSAFGGLPTEDDIFTIVNGDIAQLQMAGVNTDILREQVWPNQDLDFPSNILADRTDVERAMLFAQELDGFAQAGDMPAYVHIWLPNDHTFGASAGTPTPRSAIADNDAGLGMIVDALSHSPFWKDMAILVTEDDPQDGQDHVEAHRTISLVISPWVKRGYVSHAHHSNLSMFKTISLLLGMPPMSQFDRYATDMRDYFTTTPDFTPYDARPRQVPVETNPSAASAPNAYLRRAAQISETLNLQMVDEAGEDMGRVLRLVHQGEELERQRRR